MTIEVLNVTKHFGNFVALNDINLTVSASELVALLGPSGCGKTTLLRIIAGLETADNGRILFNGEDATKIPIHQRHVGFVFQYYALFKHMTVFDNVAFGLRMRPRQRRPDKAAIHERVFTLLKLVQLDWLADRYPQQLSGGQRQRIALARALAIEPKVLLLDEPFGALDARVRKELRRWIKQLHKELRITSIFVTHDQEEALEVADRIVIVNAGQIEQVGTPTEVYEQPATPFVYQFLGDVNLFHGRIHVGQAWIGKAKVNLDEPQAKDDAPALVYVRPHQISVEAKPNGSDTIAAILRYVRRTGPLMHLELERQEDGTLIEAQIPREQYQHFIAKVGELLFIRPHNPKVFLNAELN